MTRIKSTDIGMSQDDAMMQLRRAFAIRFDGLSKVYVGVLNRSWSDHSRKSSYFAGRPGFITDITNAVAVTLGLDIYSVMTSHGSVSSIKLNGNGMDLDAALMNRLSQYVFGTDNQIGTDNL